MLNSPRTPSELVITMSHRPPVFILLLTALAVSVLYAPQPILPILAIDFSVSKTDSALLITLCMLPLGLAPLFYGYMLEGLSAKLLLIVATLILAVCQLAMAMSSDWYLLITFRTLQGLAIPALLTALMTTMTSACKHEHVRHAAAWYVAATIVGGFTGRALTGLVTQAFNWNIAIGMWGIMLLIVLSGIYRLPYNPTAGFNKVRFNVFAKVMGIDGIRHAYIAIFCIFFVFAAMLNVLPFQLLHRNPDIGVGIIGMIYTGYIAGFITSLSTTRIHSLLGSESHTLFLGMLVFSVGLLVFLPQDIVSNFIAMFIFCGGMFLVHTSLSGQVNHLSEGHKGVVNGSYIASYYLGGSAGSWLATLIFSHYGWTVFIIVLAAFIGIAAWHITQLHQKALKLA